MKLAIALFMLLFLSSKASFAAVPPFTAFQEILTAHVKERNLADGGFESDFNYSNAKNAEVQANILQQMAILNNFEPSVIASKEEALAFWINTYNFFMIAKVLKDGFDNGVLNIESVKDLGSFFSPYKAFQQRDFKVSGKLLTLDEIEKNILLGVDYQKKQWKDARIHFAVNCASVGCPPIRASVYTAANINAILDQNVKMALKTKRHFELTDDSIRVTSLFKWYEDDFSSESGSIHQWIAGFIDNKILRDKVLSIKKVDYIDYDWSLNLPKKSSR